MTHLRATVIAACWAVLGASALPQLLCGGAGHGRSEISVRAPAAFDERAWVIIEAGGGPEGLTPLYFHDGHILSAVGIHP